MKFMVCIGLVAALLMLACGYAMAEKVGPFGHYQDTVTVSIGVPLWRDDTYIDGVTLTDNLIMDYLLEQSNIVIRYPWETDYANYEARLLAAIANKTLPDVIFIDNRAILDSLYENDMLEILDGTYQEKASDYIKGFYDSFGEDAFTTATYDGKLMAVPNLSSKYQFSLMWIRKDWLDALNLDVPATLEECVNVAQAFIDHDMSGTGNTIGIVSTVRFYGNYSKSFALDAIINTFDAYPQSWVVKEDGAIEYGSVQPQVKEALAYLRELYAKGVLDADFAVRRHDDISKLLLEGKGGICFGPWYLPDQYLSTAIEENPDANWIPVLAPLSQDGKFHPMKQNAHTVWLAVRKGYEHPEIVWELLNYQWAGARGFDERTYSLRTYYENMGVHIGDIFGVARILCQWNDAVAREARMIAEAIEKRDPSGLNPEMQYFYRNCIAWLDEHDAFGWQYYASRISGSLVASDEERIAEKPMVYPSITATMKTSWSNLEELERDTYLKIIMGEAELSEFDSFVDKWYDMGGKEITVEVNEEYRK